MIIVRIKIWLVWLRQFQIRMERTSVRWSPSRPYIYVLVWELVIRYLSLLYYIPDTTHTIKIHTNTQKVIFVSWRIFGTLLRHLGRLRRLLTRPETGSELLLLIDGPNQLCPVTKGTDESVFRVSPSLFSRSRDDSNRDPQSTFPLLVFHRICVDLLVWLCSEFLFDLNRVLNLHAFDNRVSREPNYFFFL